MDEQRFMVQVIVVLPGDEGGKHGETGGPNLFTLPKFNMELKNDGFQKEPPITVYLVPFSGCMLNFGRVFLFVTRTFGKCVS